jgi:glutamyl-tRNA synthetase
VSERVRFRFAPSPTGFLHVGGARTALFNWLAARGAGGEFLLRIEDTDVERNREEWVGGLQDALRWLGITWDGEVWRQSARLDRYREVAAALAEGGNAYWCDCTPEVVRERNLAAGGRPGYDGFCRDRGLGPGAGRALRFRVPAGPPVGFRDVVREEVAFDRANLEDFVLLRSTGMPTFLLANTVDDLDQGITHVVRGEEHLNGTPKYLLVRWALGHPGQPVFAHLPVIVNERRQKLSKRRDDVAVESYRERGYLPEAMANYLATLGWGPPDGVEIRPMSEIVELFRLDDVTRSSAFFDVKKLDHFNGVYIRGLSTDAFVERARPWLGDWADREELRRLAPLVQERVTTLAEVPRWVDFVFTDEVAIDPDAWAEVMERGRDLAVAMLDAAIEAYGSCEWRAAALHELTAALAEKLGVRLGRAQAPIRVAVTGRRVGPPLFESLEVLGRERALGRLRTARERLG